MHEITSFDCSRIAQDLQIRKVQVEAVVQLFDEGNTVPFITRYRKERTGGLNEEVIRLIQIRIGFLRQLGERKQTILKSLESQGKLSDELREAIQGAESIKRLEDLYLPYKPKKKTLASTARERGLEPLALAVWNRDSAVPNLEELLPTCVNPEKELPTVDDVRAGVQHILAEMIAETADVRADVRAVLWETGKIKAGKSEKLSEGQGLEYKDYFEFVEAIRQIPAHRVLALNRGEKEHALKINFEFIFEILQDVALKALAGHLLTSGIRGPAPVGRRRMPGGGRPNPPANKPVEGKQEVGAEATVGQDTAVVVQEATSTATESPAVHEAVAGVTPPADAGGSPVVADASVTPPADVGSAPAVADASAPPPVDAGGSPPSDAPVATPTPTVITLPPNVGESLVPGGEYRTPHTLFLRKVVDDALTRLLLPALEREIRHELTDEAETHAVAVFARNLRSLLLQPPLHGRRILAIDPGLRTGCKVAILDEYGTLVENTVVFPFGSQPKKGPREKGKRQPQDTAEQKATPDGAVPPSPTEGGGASTAEAAAGTGDAAPTVQPTDTAPATPSETVPPMATETAAATPPVTEVPSSASTPSETPVPAPQLSETLVGETPTSAVTPTETPPTAGTETPPVEAPAPPAPDRKAETRAKLKELLIAHKVHIVALGNGTGCRETEEIIADIISTDLPELAYVIVHEAGASVYSVSAYGREEFPNFDSTLRSTISIGRRLQDPLSELVKVDPPNIGVGLYQHDINRKDLRESLDAVVESCVNQVGVDLNTASVPLLRHVSGLNQLVARELFEHRQKNGAFVSRDQLMQVPGMGPTRFVQAAGFLKIPGGANPLDRTWIHPESYSLAEKVLADIGFAPQVLDDKSAQEELQTKLKAVNPEDLARKLGAGVPTIADIVQSLARPGRDPREDLPPPIFKKGILKLEDLQSGMELKGTVLNVVDFGAFVDIGLKDSGLVHISQMANRYIKSPYDVVAVSDVVTVWVLNVDKDRHRVSLTMIKPGSERKPQERRPPPPRDQQRGRPPQRRPVGAVAGGPPGQQVQQGPPGQPQDQGQGQRQDDRGQRQDDRRRGPPRGRPGPRRGPAPAGQPAHGEGQGAPPEPVKAPPPPPPPPRKPRKETPRPKLSQEAIDGKVPLRTFGELSVLFETKKEKKAPEPPREPVAAPAPAPAAESPPPPVDAAAPVENNSP
jgi:uncharacterized protein